MGIGKEQIIITETSEKGRDFNGLPLNDENIESGTALFYRDKHYTAGNRGHGLVELFTGFKRVKTVPYSEVSLVREKSKVDNMKEHNGTEILEAKVLELVKKGIKPAFIVAGKPWMVAMEYGTHGYPQAHHNGTWLEVEVSGYKMMLAELLDDGKCSSIHVVGYESIDTDSGKYEGAYSREMPDKYGDV